MCKKMQLNLSKLARFFYSISKIIVRKNLSNKKGKWLAIMPIRSDFLSFRNKKDFPS